MRKIMSLVLCIILASVIFSGCSGSGSSSTTATAGAVAVTSTATAVSTTAKSADFSGSTLGGIRYADYVKQRESERAAATSSVNTTTTAAPEPILFNGTGDMVIENVSCSELSRIIVLATGKGNFVIWAHDENDREDLLVNTIGFYGGTVYLGSKGIYTLEIKADGPWALQLENIKTTEETKFEGEGDFVTDVFEAPSRTWMITHSGESNFVVEHYDEYDKGDLLVNEIGDYSGTVYSDIKSGTKSFFVITADDVWTIEHK